MLVNARDMHGPAQATEEAQTQGAQPSNKNKENNSLLDMKQSDAVFQNFTLRGERTVKAGSLLWTWQRILTGDLFEDEGIWLPSRLLIFQVGQVFFAVFISVALFALVEVTADEADKATREITFKMKYTDTYYPDWVLDIVPEGKEVRWALLPAASISTFVCFMLCIIYLPR